MKKCSMFNSLVTRELQIKRETATQLLEWLKLKTKQNKTSLSRKSKDVEPQEWVEV